MPSPRQAIAPSDAPAVTDDASSPKQPQKQPCIAGGFRYFTPAQGALMIPLTLGIIFQIMTFNISYEPSARQPHLTEAILLSDTANVLQPISMQILAFGTLMIWHILLHAKAVAHSIGGQLKKQQRAEQDLWAVKAAAAIRISSLGAMGVHGLLWVTYLLLAVVASLDGNTFGGVEVFNLVIVAAVCIWIGPMGMKSLAIGTVRRERENTAAFVDKLQQTILAIAALQMVGFVWFAFQMANMPLTLGVTDTRLPTRDKCERDINSTYTAAHCTLRADTAITFEGFTAGLSIRDRAIAYTERVQRGGEFVCIDPSSPPFRSLFDACRMRGAAVMVYRQATGDWTCASVTLDLFLAFNLMIRGLDARLTWANIFSRGSANIKLAAASMLLACFVAVVQVLDGLTSFIHPDTSYEIILYCGLLPMLFSMVLLNIEFIIKRFRTLQDLTPKQKKALDEAKACVDEETSKGVRGFWFVDAEYLRTGDLTLLQNKTPPRMQDLRDRFAELGLKKSPLKRIVVSHKEAYQQSPLVHTHLIVSHRWLGPTFPDVTGEQMYRIREHLLTHRDIQWVWYDYWSMPQAPTTGIDDRTPADKHEFGAMLTDVNILYLGCSCLLLVDLSYISRFWTQVPTPTSGLARWLLCSLMMCSNPCVGQFEAWLSMQATSGGGLKPVGQGFQRCTAVPTLNATERDALRVLDLWAEKTPQQAHDTLELPDVTVTNQRDKAVQLSKVLSLNQTILREIGDWRRRAAANKRADADSPHQMAVEEA